MVDNQRVIGMFEKDESFKSVDDRIQINWR